MALSKEHKIVLKQEIKNNPFFLIKEILGYQDIVKLHQELIIFTTNKDKEEILILIPRGHFKSSVITIGLSIWFILHNRNIRININNKILDNAKKFLGEIKEHFESNQDLIDIYGNLKAEMWQIEQIRISGRRKILKEPTIQIGATGHEITGSHFDVIINDDLVGLKDMVSEAERINTLNFYRTLEYLKDKKSKTKIINIGTRWHLDDLYSHIINKLDKKCIMKRAAIMNNKPLFSELYTMAELNTMKNDDLIMFSAQMMNEPIPTETQLFKYSELKWFDIGSFNPALYNFVNYTDFAMSKSNQSDYTANVTLAYNEEKIFVVNAFIERQTPDVNMHRIKEETDKYKIDDIGAESNSFQELYIMEVEKFIDKSIKKIKHLKDKVLRINGIHSIVMKDVYFRQDWESAYPRLIEQLIRFPESKHDDGPDALEGAISMIKKPAVLEYDEDDYDEENVDIKKLSPLQVLRRKRMAEHHKN
jgi:predicted phage terminase large subunit-like protein